jgi:hypothetical protein
MTLEIMVLILLGGIAVNSFISAINAKGTIRIVFSYILATLVLIGSLIAIVQYVNETNIQAQRERETQLEKRLADEQKQREEEARLAAAAAAAAADTSNAGKEKQVMSALLDVTDKGIKIASSILSVDIDNVEEDEWDNLSDKASGYMGAASALQKELEEIKRNAGSTFPASISATEKAIGSLVAGASTFKRYFRAENEDEERQYKGKYAGNTNNARALFRDATKLIADKK